MEFMVVWIFMIPMSIIAGFCILFKLFDITIDIYERKSGRKVDENFLPWIEDE